MSSIHALIRSWPTWFVADIDVILVVLFSTRGRAICLLRWRSVVSSSLAFNLQEVTRRRRRRFCLVALDRSRIQRVPLTDEEFDDYRKSEDYSLSFYVHIVSNGVLLIIMSDACSSHVSINAPLHHTDPPGVAHRRVTDPVGRWVGGTFSDMSK